MRLPPKCPICGAVEKWDAEHQRFENIVHGYRLHDLARPESKRMDSTELFSLPDAKTLDKLGGRSEA